MHKLSYKAKTLSHLILNSKFSPFDGRLRLLPSSGEILSFLERSVGMEGFVKIAETDLDDPFNRGDLSVFVGLLSKESLAFSPIKQS